MIRDLWGMIYKGKLIPDWVKMKDYIMEVSLEQPYP